jgi:iron complex transport system permease protein
VNALAAGEDEARSMGIDVRRVRILLILAATLMTAASVSVSGIIGWVGLLIPHIVRMLVGPGFAAVLPLSAVIGGGFLLGVDDLARAPGTVEIPLGILTALIGAPFFALILARTRRLWF